MLLVLDSVPTVKLPTEIVDEDVGKLSAASKLVEFGLKETAPAVLSEIAVESTRSEVVIRKSPPT
jgi:phospholipid N-methyltransferase